MSVPDPLAQEAMEACKLYAQSTDETPGPLFCEGATRAREVGRKLIARDRPRTLREVAQEIGACKPWNEFTDHTAIPTKLLDELRAALERGDK